MALLDPHDRLSLIVAPQDLIKVIPDTPKGVTPVHLRQKQIYATYPQEEAGYSSLKKVKDLDWTSLPKMEDVKRAEAQK